MATRQTYPINITLDSSGGGSVEFTASGDLLVQHTSVKVLPVPPEEASILIPTAETSVNGDFLEGAMTGNLDASDTQHLMLAGDVLTCTWSGGDPGARARLTVRGIEYAAGSGMKAISGAV